MTFTFERSSPTSSDGAELAALELHVHSGATLLDECLAALRRADADAWQAVQISMQAGAMISVHVDASPLKGGMRCSVHVATPGHASIELWAIDLPGRVPLLQ